MTDDLPFIEGKNFKKDWQKHKRGGKTNLTKAKTLMTIIVQGGIIPPQYLDHGLEQWSGCRCAHFGGDYVLIYHRNSENKIVFDRIGSHNDIFR